MGSAADLVADREHVLLCFDGPVCVVFPPPADGVVAQRLRTFVSHGIPTTHDPFVVLRSAWTMSDTTGRLIELELRKHELAAVGTAPETPGTLDVVKTLALRGHTVTIVSDTSADAVVAYLARHELGRYVHEISARHSEEPTPLLPDPFLVTQAVHLLHTTPDRCCLIGDTVDVVTAARAAQVPVVVYANGTSTVDFGPHQPNAIISQMGDLL